jgi:DNA topoisomerase I
MNQSGGKYKWTTFIHNGVMFPPEYEYKHVPLEYLGKKVFLDKKNEEYAFLYAKYIKSDYVLDKTFNKNFWKDWKKSLGSKHEIKSLEGCNFTLMYDYLITNKKKVLVDKELEQKYKVAVVNGKEQNVGNFKIEPPGIFLGRGKNPKLGKIKKRIYPEDIILNIGKDSDIPTPLEGHKWKQVIHDRTVEWLASWKDTITGKTKYVWLASNSDFKAQSDKEKFNLAKKLKRKIKRIREENDKNLHSDNKKTRQIATCFYFVDKLALRVGNEKSKDEADTVGVTSLRVEHITISSDNIIILDFLGKDSVRYQNKIKVDSIIFNNLKDFVTNKSKHDNLFNLVSSNDLNKYLQGFMKDLTAKVFRTYNASYLFQKELKKITNKYLDKGVKKSIILDEFNKANAKVAVIMNHQKNIAKGYKDQLDRINESIKKVRSQLRKARKAKKKNCSKIDMLELKLKEKKSKKDVKMQLKNISLDTSKANYIDPRIAIAFLKIHDIPFDKVYSSTLRDKFKWSFDVDVNFKF